MKFDFPINLNAEPPTDNEIQSLLTSVSEDLRQARRIQKWRILIITLILIAVVVGISTVKPNGMVLAFVIGIAVLCLTFAFERSNNDLKRVEHLATSTEYSLKTVDGTDAIVISELIAHDPLLMVYTKKAAAQGRRLVNAEAEAMKEWEASRRIRDAMEKLNPNSLILLH
jgi:hypothetical protein